MGTYFAALKIHCEQLRGSGALPKDIRELASLKGSFRVRLQQMLYKTGDSRESSQLPSSSTQ